MYCWVDSPRPSLVTSVSSREVRPTRTKHNRRKRPKTQRDTTQTQENAKPTRRGGQQHPTGQKAARRAEPDKERGAGRKAAEASKRGERGRPGRQQRQERENHTGQEAGARSVSGVLKGFLDHPRANTSVQVREVPEQHPQHGREGKAHTGPKPLLP